MHNIIINMQGSFTSVQSWVNEMSRYESDLSGEDPAFIIVGNKIDLDEERVVSNDRSEVQLM